MAPLLEISGKDIAALDDTSLRELVGLLCEADFQEAGLATRGITWGGHQNAPDGGFDVVVDSEDLPPANCQIRRSFTGIQVKKPNMTAGKIPGEMAPEGRLRNSIRNLISSGGSYVIVSSSSSTSDSELNLRRDAMRNVLKSEDSQEAVYVDFLDQNRIATWVRQHPIMVLWVLKKAGRRLSGWHPYGNWVHSSEGEKEEYLLDERLRLFDGMNPTDDGVSAEEGIGRLRAVLSVPGQSVRLAGLSGVGKTRLVQALFDERVGAKSLPRHQALYCDIGDSPDPDPKLLTERLVAARERAILIVDNCPPSVHRRATEALSSKGCKVSLLSVEYDVRDDLPEETSVFRLEPASDDLIKTLICIRYPHLSEINARSISEFSNGNAKVALALANTVESGETISDLRDEELFERLFFQRHASNDVLMDSAKVLALVYSFDGESAKPDSSELATLSQLNSKSVDDLFAHAAELKSRELIQSRGIWRAVLPQAIANRLAKKALATIPRRKIEGTFLCCNNERLIRSFAHRLSFLHDSEPASAIVKGWLTEGELLGNVGRLNDFGISIFQYIAPVSPLKTLESIERAANGDAGVSFTSRANDHYYTFVRLLRSLAYDADLFVRCVEIMIRFALSENKDERTNSTRRVLQSLFRLYLSGTQASCETRVSVIRALLDSKHAEKQELGVLLLDSALEAWHFTSMERFDFGARPRDFGFSPKDSELILDWYKNVIDICVEYGLADHSYAGEIRDIAAQHFRAIWTKVGAYDDLEALSIKLHAIHPWNAGWIAVKQTLSFDAAGFNEGARSRLEGIETLLRPLNLVDKVRTYAFGRRTHALDIADVDSADSEDGVSRYERIELFARELGTQLANDGEAFSELLPELVSEKGGRRWSLGQGLAEGNGGQANLWRDLVDQLGQTENEQRNIDALRGFLFRLEQTDPKLCKSLLGGVVDDPVLAFWSPVLLTTASIDDLTVRRLHASLDRGHAQTWMYQHIAWVPSQRGLDDNQLCSLLRKITKLDGGEDTCLEILCRRLHQKSEQSEKLSEEFLHFARSFLSTYSLSNAKTHNGSIDYEVNSLCEKLFQGTEGAEFAKVACKNIASAIEKGDIYTFDMPETLNGLAKRHPAEFLDGFLNNQSSDIYRYRRSYFSELERRENPLNQISKSDILEWCEAEPLSRYLTITTALHCFEKTPENQVYQWKELFFEVVNNAPNLSEILEAISDSVRPRSWSGSRADILEGRLKLFTDLFDHQNSLVQSWAQQSYTDVQELVANEREREAIDRWHRDERFE